MRQSSFIGSRLYNQIVYPLLAAAVVVGVVATFVAVYFLGNLTNQWVNSTADGATTSIVSRMVVYVEQMQNLARFASTTQGMSAAARSGDPEKFRQQLTIEAAALSLDSMFVLDEFGRLIAHSGKEQYEVGTELFGDTATMAGRQRVALVKLGNAYRLVLMQPMNSPDRSYILVLTKVIDEDFLHDMGVIEDSAFALYTARGDRVAVAFGKGLSFPVIGEIQQVTKRYSPDIGRAIGTSIEGAGTSSLRVGNSSFAVRAKPVFLPEEIHPGTFGYVVGIVSQGVSEAAGRTTTNLISMWSVVAVIALVGLGGWVARRVSEPLVALTEGARRIADGDFDTKVRVRGTNEVAELADMFNEMTDSLRTRTETLTKKVLELATLYELSRSLGATLDLDQLLESVLESSLRIFDLDLGYISLRDRDTGDLEIRCTRGKDGPKTQEVRSSMSEWVVREGRPLIFNPDAGAKSAQIDTVTGAKAALCIPLLSPDGPIGSVTIGSSDVRYRFDSDDVRLLSTIANHVTIAIGNIELFTSLQEAYLATVRSLAAAVDAKDSYTRGHSERVATYGTLIAEKMGLAHEQRIALEMAAYLHDIGKIGVREEILLKPGSLTGDEMESMRHHPLIGANILRPVAFPWAITPVVRHHHESYDGTGYPAGLRGEEIPLLARILTVADSFEAMTADRPYRAGRSWQEALEELSRCSGTQFDPRIVDVFCDVIEEIQTEGDPTRPESVEEVLPDEARGVFSALVMGLFQSFRRLGGPRLATNVENETDAYLTSEGVPFRIVQGKVNYTNDVAEDLDAEIEQMRGTLSRIDAIMSRVSGSSLVDHFYEDAFSDFSGRMRYLARVLGFTQASG